MFEFIRSHQRLMQLLLLLLILPSFAFFGVQGLSKFEGGGGVAKVDGQSVSQTDVDNLMRQQMQRMQQMLGPNFDPKMFDTPQAREQALNTVISQRVLQTQMARDRLAVSQDRVNEEIRNIPAIKALYKPDGTIDMTNPEARFFLGGGQMLHAIEQQFPRPALECARTLRTLVQIFDAHEWNSPSLERNARTARK